VILSASRCRYLFLTRLFRKYDGSQQQLTQQQQARANKLVQSPRSPTTPAIEQAERGDTASNDGAGSGAAGKQPLWVAAAKVLVDQTTFGVFSNWIYFFVIGAFNGTPLHVTQAKVATDFWPLMVANWRVSGRTMQNSKRGNSLRLQ